MCGKGRSWNTQATTAVGILINIVRRTSASGRRGRATGVSASRHTDRVPDVPGLTSFGSNLTDGGRGRIFKWYRASVCKSRLPPPPSMIPESWTTRDCVAAARLELIAALWAVTLAACDRFRGASPKPGIARPAGLTKLFFHTDRYGQILDRGSNRESSKGTRASEGVIDGGAGVLSCAAPKRITMAECR